MVSARDPVVAAELAHGKGSVSVRALVLECNEVTMVGSVNHHPLVKDGALVDLAGLQICREHRDVPCILQPG
jgi:hypothetical protein